MVKIIRSRDWSSHALGAIENWPQSLKTALGICLNSKFPMLVWWGPDLLVFYNDAYIPFVGLKHPQFLGLPAREQWKEIWPSLEPLTQQVLKSGTATWAESMLLYMNRSGYLEETYFTFSYSPIIDETGAIVGIINPCQETTKRVLSERRLKSLQDLSARETTTIKDIGEIASEVLAANHLDIPFALIYLADASNTHAELIGASGIAPGMPLAPKKTSLQALESIWPILKLKRHGVKVENLRSKFMEYLPTNPYQEGPDSAYVLPLMSGRQNVSMGYIILGISSRLIFDDLYQGYFDLIGKQTSIHIRNLYALEDEKKRVEELSALNKAKTDFFNNVSHELRTPLTLILGPLEELLIQSTLPQSVRTELDIIYRNAIRLLKLVNNLLDFSRIESQRMEALFEPVNLCEMTTIIASGFSSAIEKAGLKYEIQCDASLREVYVDKEMWENIVINLLSNAFKYTLTGMILLTLERNGDHVELSVRDTGVGIPSKDINKIFQRFYRVNDIRGRTHEGTGIGLALVKELVDLHKGSIKVESELDAGSTFTVTIPLGKAHLAAEKIKENIAKHDKRYMRAYLQEAMSLTAEDVRPAKKTEPVEQKIKSRIVVAEDNKDMRDYISGLLSPLYAVQAFENGEKAFNEIQRNPPDLVVSDVMMPVMDGFELIKKIRADKDLAETPIILVSARAGQESAITGIDSGADDYLAKPFSARELMARVHQHVMMYNLRKETAQMKDHFLASITHELRSPLTAIMGFITLMHDGDVGPVTEDQKESLSMVLANTEHLLSLINELLDLAKIESGKVEFKLEKVDLNKLADEVKHTMQPLLAGKNIKINFEIHSQMPGIFVDGLRLKQVLYNYINNAIKFSYADGKIAVRLTVTDHQLMIEVEDYGTGIREEDMAKLFREFQQLKTDPHQKESGTGLGLYITKRIVEAQGGKVGVKSQLGKGSTFSAVIPITR